MIHFRNATRGSGLDARRLKNVACELLREAGEGDSTLSLSLVGDREIRELNRVHRGKDKATDVLSFPLLDDASTGSAASGSARNDNPERLLGDVVISVETARRQAAEYGAPLENEIHRLLIHGILHVLGHDHEKPLERAVMEAEERRLAAVIGMPWPYE